MAEDSTSQRLRQAIVNDDQLLARRILKTRPALLRNPDFDDKSNTSLHLAAKHGLFEIAVYLIELGHDNTVEAEFYIHSNTENNQGISVNTDGQIPLHLAAANAHAPMTELLCQKFPQGINRYDKKGLTPLLLAAKAQTKSVSTNGKNQLSKGPIISTEDTSTIEVLLEYGADVSQQDQSGNTCLHHACAWGNLKVIRTLIEAGADPLCSNYAGWMPGYYSLTVQAEVYYKNLVAEYEQRKNEERRIAEEHKAKTTGSVRLVTGDDDDDDGSDDGSDNGFDDDDSGDESRRSDDQSGGLESVNNRDRADNSGSGTTDKSTTD